VPVNGNLTFTFLRNLNRSWRTSSDSSSGSGGTGTGCGFWTWTVCCFWLEAAAAGLGVWAIVDGFNAEGGPAFGVAETVLTGVEGGAVFGAVAGVVEGVVAGAGTTAFAEAGRGDAGGVCCCATGAIGVADGFNGVALGVDAGLGVGEAEGGLDPVGESCFASAGFGVIPFESGAFGLASSLGFVSSLGFPPPMNRLNLDFFGSSSGNYIWLRFASSGLTIV